MQHSLCHADESYKLMPFKESVTIRTNASYDPIAYPKVESWKLREGHVDCCFWDGVHCDKRSGHVIGLDLSSSFLYGSIHEIPSSMGNLTSSKTSSSSSYSFLLLFCSLNLIFLPTFSHVHNISALSPKHNPLCHGDENSALLQFIQSFVIDINASIDPLAGPKSESWKLQGDCCSWDGVHCDKVSGHVISLDLSSSCLYGSINSSNSLFRLIHLRSLNLADNYFNYSQLPSTLGYLSELTYLNLSHSYFAGQIPSNISQLSKLSVLWLRENDQLILKKPVFESLIQNLTSLEVLGLSYIDISSTIPNIMANLSSLKVIRLGSCGLYGEFPTEIFQLPLLQTLFLANNNLSGAVELATIVKPKNLINLSLSGNNMSLLDNVKPNATVQKFSMLGLGNCNLFQFPLFLRDQDELSVLDLSSNYIHDQIPHWLRNTSFEQDPVVLQWTRITYLDLSDNQLSGSLPIPPPSIKIYAIQNNPLMGEISSIICRLNSLQVLDLSGNNLNGALPQCFGNFSTSVQLLDLGGNNFHGQIPHIGTTECNLRLLNLKFNKLQGQIPRSLANCAKLEYLVLSNNEINDVFPSWLGSLQELKILILGSNQLYGVLGNHKSNFDFDFPKLHIIDLSQNNFSGQLPQQYFLSWNAMKTVDANQYMVREITIELSKGNSVNYTGVYKISLKNKGTNLIYSAIQQSLVAIDLSCNKLEGEIPDVVGNLNALRALNFSYNNLRGGIPSSLGNLTMLESLDLSQNNLSGEIPQQLTQLNFLAVFNVSHNHLTGPIPHGKQFDTFQSNSYEANLGLCGNPMPRKCTSSEALPPLPSKSEGNEDLSYPFEFDWKCVLMGYGSGLIIGHIFATRKYKWLLKTFRLREP
ncbi:receptor like protein 27-like [Hevea brasiliensis]|uniref:receptor like protein 27-like n=1 Tax=Hevea brasiliensis TaxID=3981 RepID=UPI0025EA853D|nr:receptor like protein 27-like [Hevea brasiliensis]